MIPRNDLVQIVSEDLQYLKEEWNESVEDSALKRGNTVLRRLLVQNELQRAWRAVGLPSQPLIRASALKPILDEIPREKIVLAGAGGARYKGIELRGILIANYAMNKTEIKSQHEAGVPSAKMKLCDFIDAPCVVVSGELVPRRMLINYIANKLGGAHFDTKRKTDERIFALLDEARAKFKFAEKPAVYFELLSIGQAVAHCEDVSRFLGATKTSAI